MPTPLELLYREIPLTQGQVAIVDAGDYDWLNQWKWCAVSKRHKFYAARNITTHPGKQSLVYMHRIILGLDVQGSDFKDNRCLTGDHVNRDTLDNRRINLRLATKSQQVWNTSAHIGSTSGLKGASFDKRAGKWRADICHKHKKVYIGCFSTPEEAHSAYCEYASRLRGDYAIA